jgi:hypothetical protein
MLTGHLFLGLSSQPNLANYRVMGWVDVSYGSVWGLEVAAKVRVRSTIKLEGIGGSN